MLWNTFSAGINTPTVSTLAGDLYLSPASRVTRQQSGTAFLPQMIMQADSNDANAAYRVFLKTRAAAAIQNGDTLGNLSFQGLETGLTFKTAVNIVGIGRSVGAGFVNGRINFDVMDAAGVLATRMQLNSDFLYTTVPSLVNTATNQSNGRIQLATHTALTDGIGFFDFGLYRNGANRLACSAANEDHAGNVNVAGILAATQVQATGGGDVEAVSGAFKQAGSVVVGSRRAGWGVPTGTISRATFDQSTVTLAQLAQRVAALIQDLHSTSSGHGLIGP